MTVPALREFIRIRRAEEQEKQSKSPPPKDGKGVMSGRGLLAPATSERYDTLGRYLVHLPSLRKGVLNLKYPSKAVIPGLAPFAISSELR
eukprot:47176-Eustigmatos_ZCMA.PRE.1